MKDGLLLVEGAHRTSPGCACRWSSLLRAVHFPRAAGTGRTFVQEAFYEPPTELPDWEKGYGNMSANYTYGTQGVEVEVDEETGEVRRS